MNGTLVCDAAVLLDLQRAAFVHMQLTAAVHTQFAVLFHRQRFPIRYRQRRTLLHGERLGILPVRQRQILLQRLIAVNNAGIFAVSSIFLKNNAAPVLFPALVSNGACVRTSRGIDHRRAGCIVCRGRGKRTVAFTAADPCTALADTVAADGCDRAAIDGDSAAAAVPTAASNSRGVFAPEASTMPPIMVTAPPDS